MIVRTKAANFNISFIIFYLWIPLYIQSNSKSTTTYSMSIVFETVLKKIEGKGDCIKKCLVKYK